MFRRSQPLRITDADLVRCLAAMPTPEPVRAPRPSATEPLPDDADPELVRARARRVMDEWLEEIYEDRTEDR